MPKHRVLAGAAVKQLSAALKFAQCIRANGVKDFPDPSTVSPSSTRRKSHPPTGRVV
jgi:hypothetical protein